MPISATASVSIYNVGGGTLQILENIRLDKKSDEKVMQSDVINIVDSYWQK